MTSQALSTETGAPPGLNDFWSDADERIHDAQKSLRSARQVAAQIGEEAAQGDYGQIIALGHRLGGFGHDHATPADNEPVISMLDTMLGSIDALTKVASTSAELEEASSATEADLSKLSLRAQRLYHLLSAKKQLSGVRTRAIALGFRPEP